MEGRKQELFDQFLVQLGKLKRCMEQRSHTSASDKAATMLQLHALLFIQDKDAVTVSSLAQYLALSSSAIAQLSDRLVESAWVAREHDNADRRIVHLKLTEKGKEKLKAVKEARKKLFADMVHVLSEEELETLVKIFTRLTESASTQGKK